MLIWICDPAPANLFWLVRISEAVIRTYLHLMSLASRASSVLPLLLLLAVGCGNSAHLATKKRCPVPADHVAILDTSATRKSGPLITGQATQISHKDIERMECLLRDFISWHLAIGHDKRDSLHIASGGRIRPECFTRNWSQDFRQYAGERTPRGDLLVHIQSMCHRPSNYPGLEFDLSKSWLLVNDGGDCYLHAVINLSLGRVEEYGFNGPYQPLEFNCE